VSTVLNAPAPAKRVVTPLPPLSHTRVMVLVSITVFLALAAYYFVGVDEGMSSVFGKTLAVHEWVHDARHFLGFPCH
jgi:Probable cobalt transporter subunit (CbtB)